MSWHDREHRSKQYKMKVIEYDLTDLVVRVSPPLRAVVNGQPRNFNRISLRQGDVSYVTSNQVDAEEIKVGDSFEYSPLKLEELMRNRIVS